MKRIGGRVAIALGLWAAGATLSLAQAPSPAAEDPTVEAEESRSQAFQAVDGAVKEDIAGGPLMLAAYAVVWLVVFGYVLRLVALQRRTLEEIDELKRIVESAGGAGADASAGEAGSGADAGDG